jgi:hypothetical protein
MNLGLLLDLVRALGYIVSHSAICEQSPAREEASTKRSSCTHVRSDVGGFLAERLGDALLIAESQGQPRLSISEVLDLLHQPEPACNKPLTPSLLLDLTSDPDTAPNRTHHLIPIESAEGNTPPTPPTTFTARARRTDSPALLLLPLCRDRRFSLRHAVLGD